MTGSDMEAAVSESGSGGSEGNLAHKTKRIKVSTFLSEFTKKFGSEYYRQPVRE